MAEDIGGIALFDGAAETLRDLKARACGLRWSVRIPKRISGECWGMRTPRLSTTMLWRIDLRQAAEVQAGLAPERLEGT